MYACIIRMHIHSIILLSSSIDTTRKLFLIAPGDIFVSFHHEAFESLDNAYELSTFPFLEQSV